MRADRLLSIVMLLQGRGSMTAQELASELDVSVRTIYRDMDALCMAGIPYESEAGSGGGYRLEKGYRSNLHGLKIEELRALSSLHLPLSMLPPVYAKNLQSAIIKLQSKSHISTGSTSFPTARCYIDGTSWSSTEWKDPVLSKIYQAICDQNEVVIHYRFPVRGDTTFLRTIQPYGLFLYQNNWIFFYASKGVYEGHTCQDIVSLDFTKQSFTVPDESEIKKQFQQWKLNHRPPEKKYIATLLIPQHLENQLEEYLNKDWIPQLPKPPNYKKVIWIKKKIKFRNLEEARRKILMLGCMVKVLSPVALQCSIQDFAHQILSRYTS